MVDRVSASIEIGGAISREDFSALSVVIADEGLAAEWDGEPFEAEHHIAGQSLRLFAHEVAWGRFDLLEARCRDLGLAYARWSGGNGGQWGPQRVISTGAGEPVSYPVDEDNVVVMCRESLEQMGSLETAYAWFDAADFPVPPLVVGAALPPEAA